VLPSRAVVGAIVGKDLRLFVRDRFYLLVTVMGLVFYVAVFWVLPAAADDTYEIGVHLPGGVGLLGALPADDQEGLRVVPYGSSAALAAAVQAGDEIIAGLDFPPGYPEGTTASDPATVRVLLAAGAPEELRPALVAGVREIAHAIAGDELPVTLPAQEDVILGVDRAGQQLSLREQMRPLLVFLVLIVEMFALASLVASEIAQRTITALLTTPARTSDVLLAKALLGTLLAFSQALVLALATGTLARAPVLLTVTLLLGALLVTGFGLLAGATGKDFVTIVFWSVLLVVPLAIPAFAVLFPGAAAWWVRLLPTYSLVETVVGAASYGEGWAEAAPRLLALSAWCVVVLAAGTVVLGRRVRRA
jgi:ABC-2 type transport system permease protein